MTQRTSTEIATDLTAARAARTAIVAGERVNEVSRDGRRMIYAGITLKELNQMIADLAREYEQAVRVEAGNSRRRPIGVMYRN